MRSITFTMDLEDYGLKGRDPVPIDDAVDAILRAASAARALGTVFVVGTLAERRPDLVQRCADEGHEVALHGYRHVPIDQLGHRGFIDDLARGRAAVEDALGRPIIGYRAPLFSLTNRTPWAPDALAKAGFVYSSSVLPARNPIRGYPGAPRAPFRWASGLIEFPCPVGGSRGVEIPYLGGVYMRYLPMSLVRRWGGRADPAVILWLYCHPYDADVTGRALQLPHAGRLTTAILGLRRRATPSRVATVLAGSPGSQPLGELVANADTFPLMSPT